MLVLAVLLVVIGGGVVFGLVYARMEAPNLARLRAGQHPHLGLATLVYSADGHELTRYYRENRTWISYPQFSPALLETLVATEDRRFYDHHGVDWMRLAASLWKTARGHRQGGSTLTMQLARNFFPDIGQAPALQRKLYEIATALKIERSYLKHEIVEMYLNTVPFGYHAFGIETAAQTYFNKSASALNEVESATLVGMLKGITRYNPVRNPERARQRRNVVLGQVARFGSLDPATLDSLRREPLGLDFQFNIAATGPAPHFAETIRTWLADWAAGQGYDLYTSGLRVYRSIRACRRWPRRRSRRSYAGCKPSLGTNGAAVGLLTSATPWTSTSARRQRAASNPLPTSAAPAAPSSTSTSATRRATRKPSGKAPPPTRPCKPSTSTPPSSTRSLAN